MDGALKQVLQGEDVNAAAGAVAKATEDPFAFWNQWFDCAAHHADAQDRLIALVQALQKHDVGIVDDQRLWGDLPRLPWSMRESFQRMSYRADPSV